MNEEETYTGRHRHDGPDPECTCTPVVTFDVSPFHDREGMIQGMHTHHEDHCAIVVERRARLHLTAPPG